jgi:hypothetical protein
MTFEILPTPEEFGREKGSQLHNLITVTFEKEIYIVLGKVRTHLFMK